MALPEDVIAKVRQDFGEDDAFLVLQELKNLQSEDDNMFCDRLLRCIVFLAKGSIKKFDQEVTATRCDPRDVIVAGEGWACNALLMNHPFPAQLDQALCRQWLVGRKVRLPWAKESDGLWEMEAADIRELELRRITREELAEGDPADAQFYLALIRMLCVRGQAIGSSPAFEMWWAMRYEIDRAGAFALRGLQHSPKKIKQMGKWP